MGYSEYDRIRSKNRLHNYAYEQYLKLKAIGLSDTQIIGVCNNLISLDEVKHIKFRRYIIQEMEKIINGQYRTKGVVE